MPRKQSVKPLLKVGSVIRTGLAEFWEVTALLESKFQCKRVHHLGTKWEYTQEFYYSVSMIVYNESGRNIS